MLDLDYELLDIGGQRKLERVGAFRLIRPAPQALGRAQYPKGCWDEADFEFVREQEGKGRWKSQKTTLLRRWSLGGQLPLSVRLTDFGHIGVFPEHLESFLRVIDPGKLGGARVLNLFAYTGMLSLVLARSGVNVTHVDASPKSVLWAQDNAKAVDLARDSIRWITEDVRKFVARELRRGRSYDGMVLDPPSFGRGSKGEVWKIESDLLPLLDQLVQLLSPRASFVFLSNHTPGISGLVLQDLLMSSFGASGQIRAEEMQIAVSDSKRALASGFFAAWQP